MRAQFLLCPPQSIFGILIEFKLAACFIPLKEFMENFGKRRIFVNPKVIEEE